MAASLTDLALNATIFIITWIHLLLAPYTKVEESFNMQATHDILVYGMPASSAKMRLSATYDHFTFPGAVPRTFLGSVVLAGLSQPVIALVGFAHAQLVVRAMLGIFNSCSLLAFRFAVDKTLGKATGRWWVLLMACQFHLPFYMTRTLPNMFSFGLTTLAAASFLYSPTSWRSQKIGIFLLVISAAVFRSETAILLATTCLNLLIRGRIDLRTLIQTGVICSVACVAASVAIDSYFWQKFPLWPELAAFYFNAILGSSSEWGVSAWHYYFSSGLPRLLLNPATIALIFVALVLPATSKRTLDLVLPNLAFVAVYSIQPHKEARFIFYVVPSLTAAAALAASYISNRVNKSKVYLLASLAIASSVAACFAASIAMLLLSSLNYPGGDALNQLSAIASPSQGVLNVHADVLTCMTGLTLFGQNPAGIPIALGSPSAEQLIGKSFLVFDKTEDDRELAKPAFWKQFDFVLAEEPAKVVGGSWKTLGVVEGYAGVEVLRPGQEVNDEEGRKYHFLGRGAVVSHLRDVVRSLSGGWWIGPRMTPSIYIMQQIHDETNIREARM